MVYAKEWRICARAHGSGPKGEPVFNRGKWFVPIQEYGEHAEGCLAVVGGGPPTQSWTVKLRFGEQAQWVCPPCKKAADVLTAKRNKDERQEKERQEEARRQQMARHAAHKFLKSTMFDVMLQRINQGGGASSPAPLPTPSCSASRTFSPQSEDGDSPPVQPMRHCSPQMPASTPKPQLRERLKASEEQLQALEQALESMSAQNAAAQEQKAAVQEQMAAAQKRNDAKIKQLQGQLSKLQAAEEARSRSKTPSASRPVSQLHPPPAALAPSLRPRAPPSPPPLSPSRVPPAST